MAFDELFAERIRRALSPRAGIIVTTETLSVLQTEFQKRRKCHV